MGHFWPRNSLNKMPNFCHTIMNEILDTLSFIKGVTSQRYERLYPLIKGYSKSQGGRNCYKSCVFRTGKSSIKMGICEAQIGNFTIENHSFSRDSYDNEIKYSTYYLYIPLLRHCHDTVTTLSRHCHDIVTTLSRHCHAIVTTLSRHLMTISRLCHDTWQWLPINCHVDIAMTIVVTMTWVRILLATIFYLFSLVWLLVMVTFWLCT